MIIVNKYSYFTVNSEEIAFVRELKLLSVTGRV